MSVLTRRWFPLGLLLGALLVAGCKKELPKEGTYPTRGRVLFKGQPVRFALIRLVPTGATGQPAKGVTGADGTFTLRTLSNDEPDGAIPGTYEVELEEYDPVKAGRIPKGATPTRLPPEAQKPGVTVEVAAEDNDLNIEIP